MAWKKPLLTEMALSSEVNAYTCGDQFEGEIFYPSHFPRD